MSSERRLKFAREYFRCGIGAQAAKRAGYTGQASTLAVRGSELLRHPVVVEELERLRGAARASAVMDREECLQRLAAIARFDFAAVMDSKRRGFDLEHAAPSALACVERIKIDDKGVTVGVPSRIEAINSIARLEGWNAAERVDLTFSGLSDAELAAEIEREIAKRASTVSGGGKQYFPRRGDRARPAARRPKGSAAK